MMLCWAFHLATAFSNICLAQEPGEPGVIVVNHGTGGNCDCNFVTGEIKHLSINPANPFYFMDAEPPGTTVTITSKAYAKNSRFKARNFFHGLLLYEAIIVEPDEEESEDDEDTEPTEPSTQYGAGDAINNTGDFFLLEKCDKKDTSDLSLSELLLAGKYFATSKIAKIDYREVETIENGVLVVVLEPEMTILDSKDLIFDVNHGL
jgi:hypothetical protein